MKKSYIAVLLNLLYWLPKIFTLSLFFVPHVADITIHQVKLNFLVNVVYISADFFIFYSFYFLLFPSFFSKRDIGYFIIFGLIIILIVAAAAYNIVQWIAPGYLHLPIWYWPVSFTVSGIYVASVACLIRAFLNWYSDIVYKKQLEKKNLETSLALLKAQINPHFLFNTLNNIDVLIEKDAHTASVYLKKLSDILRFVLYQSPSEKIKLSQEVEYIRKYIELQKIRTSNTGFVNFNVSGKIDDVYIAPMLFIPYIENAFKHSTDKKINNAIEISIAVQGDGIHFSCSNAVDATGDGLHEKSGLGLDLISSRLNMLYKDHYQLKIDRSDTRFNVSLLINPHEN